MKILWVASQPIYFRYFESTIRLLAQRGHRVYLAVNTARRFAEHDWLEALAKELPGVEAGEFPRRRDGWQWLAAAVRLSMDCLRYLHPRYDRAPRLRARAESYPIGPLLRRLKALPAGVRGWGVRVCTQRLAVVERAIPSCRNLDRALGELRPDLVCVTPLIEFASGQVDVIKSANRLGLPTALAVASWDNLTNKGLIRVPPDRVLVWNDYQAKEAIELHGVAPDKVVVIGAACFDDWFGRRAASARDDFCRKAGLDPREPFVLFVGSSHFVAPDELRFFQEWARRVRSAEHSALHRVGVLVRLHPDNREQWAKASLAGLGHVAVWDQDSGYPLTEDSKQRYFDSIYHSAAVVGVNTSALLEAAVVGRPTLTILVPENSDGQAGTLHFDYLRTLAGGLLRVGATWQAHLAQLTEVIGGSGSQRNEEFLRAFIRPFGLERPCTPRVVDAIESLARTHSPAREAATVGDLVLRALLRPAALSVNVLGSKLATKLVERTEPGRARVDGKA